MVFLLSELLHDLRALLPLLRPLCRGHSAAAQHQVALDLAVTPEVTPKPCRNPAKTLENEGLDKLTLKKLGKPWNLPPMLDILVGIGATFHLSLGACYQSIHPLSSPACRGFIPRSIRAACGQGATGSVAGSAAAAATPKPSTRRVWPWMGNGWMDRWMDGCTYVFLYVIKVIIY